MKYIHWYFMTGACLFIQLAFRTIRMGGWVGCSRFTMRSTVEHIQKCVIALQALICMTFSHCLDVINIS